jgi:hypothetical protein
VLESGHRGERRSPVWFALAVGLSLRIGVVIAVHVYHGPFLFLDDRGYDMVGAKLADAWRDGIFPDPSAVGLAGSSTYGYFTWVGVVYYLVGSSWLLVKVVGAVISSLAVVPAAAIGRSLGGPRMEVVAAWLVAVYPTAVFWGSVGLKDAPLLTLFLAVTALGFRAVTLKRLAVQVALCGVAFSMRPGLGAVCLLALAPPILEGLRRRGDVLQGVARRSVALVGGVAFAYVAFTNVGTLLDFAGRSAVNEGILALPPGSESAGSLPNVSSFITALMGPFPWAFGEGTDTVYRALYPGMVIWIALLPAGALGAWDLLRHGSAGARGLAISTVAYFAMYLAYFGNEGFFRQRFLVELVVLVFAGFTFLRRPQAAVSWTAVWLICMAPAIAIQTGIIPAWGVALILGCLFVVLLLPSALKGRRLA